MGCLLLGTEDGRLLVLDPAGTRVMHSWKAGGVPAFLTVTGMHHGCHAQAKGGAALNSAAVAEQCIDGICSIMGSAACQHAVNCRSGLHSAWPAKWAAHCCGHSPNRVVRTALRASVVCI